MFEFEDLSAGFHDIISNKYTDSSGPILDFYISDSMQDILDIDIRSEVATVVGGGLNEFSSSFNDLPTSLDLDLGTNDGELSWLGGPKWSATTDIYADVGACVNPNSVMPLITSSLLNSSKAQINLNTTTSTTTTNSKINNSPPTSPKENKSHLTFSPHQIKVPSVVVQHENKQYYQRPSPLATTVTSINNNNRNLVENIKKDLSSTDLKDDNNKLSIKINNKKSSISIPTTTTSNILSSGTGTNTIKLGPGIGGLTFSNSISYNRLKQSNTVKLSGGMNGIVNGNIAIKNNQKELLNSLNNSNQLLNNSGNIMINENNSNTTTTHLIQQQNSTSNKILSRSILVQNNKNNMVNGINTSNHHHHNNHHQHHSHHTSSTSSSSSSSKITTKSSIKPVEHEYPKPAYSYSCLIAMALKNSRSGSLPVSEIYSFICEHFPHFKTAPNGWKNSVRHNLSLNKCFEKIEKPITNGGQRKGCLWAMNPAKITKMDEELQKWSRKDPMAIRKAMVHPENLEALERGEMKHGSNGDSDEEINEENDVQYEDNEENSESEHEEHDLDEHLVETQDEEDDEHNGTTIKIRGRTGIDDDNKEFDVEVTDIYDAIDLEDDKDALHRTLQQHHQRNCDLSSDTNDIHNSSSLSKKARLDVNYSISPAEIFEQRIQQQQTVTTTQHHNRRKMPLVNRIA